MGKVMISCSYIILFSKLSYEIYKNVLKIHNSLNIILYNANFGAHTVLTFANLNVNMNLARN